MGRRKCHRHQLDFVSWFPDPVHFHEYYTTTTVNDRHSHVVAGVTSPAAGGIDYHVHCYEGVTSFDDGHVHRFRGVTGPPIPGGGHVHDFQGETTFDDGHRHYYHGRTGVAM
jgi:hypothetical protein